MHDPIPAPYPPPSGGAAAPSAKRLKLAGVIALCVAAAVVVGGVVSRVHANQNLKAWTQEQSIPTVQLAAVQGGGDHQMVLPGDVQAYYNAPIHARVSGYLKRWYVDIGGAVKAGQLLAEIDSPEVDQQVLQARADLAAAQANQRLSATTAKRWEALAAQDAVSRQEADEKSGDLAAKTAAVNASKANLDRLLAMEGFKRITAPFDGVVTSRSTDIGALISVGGPADAALFTVADQRRLRVYVRVPQNQSAMIHHGMIAKLTVPEYPGQVFQAVVANDSRSVDTQTGSLLVELQLDNQDGRLKPGEYAQVSFTLSSAPAAVRLPATAIQFRQGKPTVATVGPDSHVRVQPVTITRDLGAVVEIGSGVSPNERIIDNPPESLANGDLVRVTAAGGAGKGDADDQG